MPLDGRELDVHDELREQQEKAEAFYNIDRKGKMGVFIPKQSIGLHALQEDSQNRAAQEILRHLYAENPDVIKQAQDGTASTGLIQDSLMPNLFISALRPMTGLMNWGCRILDGLREDILVPEQTSNTSGAWIDPDEQDDPPGTSATYSQVPLSMKTYGVLVEFTRMALKQSRPAVDMLIAGDIMRTISIAVQDAALIGNGANNSPKGITNTTSVISQQVPDARRVRDATANPVKVTASPNRDDVLKLLGQVADANANMEGARFVMKPSRFYDMLQKKIDDGSGLFMVDRQSGRLEGFPVERYSQLNDNTIIYGNFSDMMLGFFGNQMEYRADLQVSGGGRHDRIYCDMDVAIRHKKAFGVLAARTGA